MKENCGSKIAQIDISRLAGAVRKLAIAASSNIGSDCYIHAALGQALLAKLEIKSDLISGKVAWRVGPGSGDVIMHAPAPGMVDQPGAAAYHVWLEVEGHIFDTTLYQLRPKAIMLDRLDGGHTNVTWCPDYLFTPKSSISLLNKVIQQHAGLYYYSRDLNIEAKVLATAPELEEGDVHAAWVLYQNPGIVVYGPNSERAK